MRSQADGPVLAAYKEHQWLVDEQSYFRLDCTTTVSVRFIRESELSRKYGPFHRFSAVNGLAYGDDHVIAFLDYKKNEWLYYDTGTTGPLWKLRTSAAGNNRAGRHPEGVLLSPGWRPHGIPQQNPPSNSFGRFI
jgi:hypothetical protein